MLCLAEMPSKDRTRARLLRGVEHIEREVDGAISLAEVASCAALSEFHFHRLFRAHFGLPVMDYVRRRRLARAAEALLETRTPILHIAMEAGFQSQAAFTRAFRRIYHAAPAAWRARGRDVPWLSAGAIDAKILAVLPGLGVDQPRLEHIEDFAIDGVSARMEDSGRAGIPALWERLVHLSGFDRFDHCDCIGISEGDEAVLGGILTYTAAVTANHDDPRVAGLHRRVVPGGSFLVFRFEGDFGRISQAYDHIFGTWMPGSRHALRAGPSFTRMPAGDVRLAPGGLDIWIPVEG